MTPFTSVVTTAFGSSDKVIEWAGQWTRTVAECVVADNGGLLDRESLSDDVQLVPWRGNDGFGVGINRAVMKASGELILITNPDTLPLGDHSLDRLIAYHREGTLTGGKTQTARGRLIPSSGICPDLTWLRGQLLASAGSLYHPDRTDWIQGSLILVHKKDFQDLGGFSKNFPLYFEDTDLCARASKQGMSISICEEALFLHEEGTGSSGTSSVRLAGFHWGFSEFFRIHRSEEFSEARKFILLTSHLREWSSMRTQIQFFTGVNIFIQASPGTSK